MVAAASPWTPAALPAVADSRLEPWLRRSLEDLDGLRMARPQAPDDVFFAAGAPWYLTLFGRDSLWAARLLLPGRAWSPPAGPCARWPRLQGTKTDVERRPSSRARSCTSCAGRPSGWATMSLPPLYYGTIDATPLWVCLLHDAWRAGLPEAEVRELLPALEAALGWLLTDCDADGDGFLEYLDATGHGLANQGWKDSCGLGPLRDGTDRRGPGRAVRGAGLRLRGGALAGAALLDAFGRPGRRAATGPGPATLADRFRAAFWVGERRGPLSRPGPGRRTKQPVDAPDQQHRPPARHRPARRRGGAAGGRPGSPARRWTRASGCARCRPTDAGYSPLSYHCGSVWPHDTAIVVAGLARAGLAEHAAGLVEGLLRASVAFDAAAARAVERRGPPGPLPGLVPTAGLVGRGRRRGRPGARGGLVAVLTAYG